MSNDQYVITTLLRMERDEAYEAIRNIWRASQDDSQTDVQHAADMDQIIFEAATLLPEMQGLKAAARADGGELFEDLF